MLKKDVVYPNPGFLYDGKLWTFYVYVHICILIFDLYLQISSQVSKGPACIFSSHTISKLSTGSQACSEDIERFLQVLEQRFEEGTLPFRTFLLYLS